MSLHKSLPWTKSPLIINAPMGGIAGGDLAIAVAKAGGLGQIGGVPDYDDLSTQLSKADEALHRTSQDLLPVGVGILLFAMKAEASIPILEKYKPAVVWLFAENQLSEYATWTEKVRKVLPKSQIWIQIGSVRDALEVARTAKPDVFCCQGQDAGGHGPSQTASIISLLPEVAEALTEAGYGNIALVAAGGISSGTSAAAAFTLGAQGVVMGTRFLAAPETKVHPTYRAAILNARDGGESTVRAKLFDELKGPNEWPEAYDGRSIRTDSWKDHQAGVGIEEIRRRAKEASKEKDAGFADDGGGRAATWAGTGVGLVKAQQPAADIVEEVRRCIVVAMDGARARL